jgi:hypothetical protein
MFEPRIISQYVYRVTECRSNPIDALADSALYWGVNIFALAQFLRAIDAPGATRLTLI